MIPSLSQITGPFPVKGLVSGFEGLFGNRILQNDSVPNKSIIVPAVQDPFSDHVKQLQTAGAGLTSEHRISHELECHGWPKIKRLFCLFHGL